MLLVLIVYGYSGFPLSGIHSFQLGMIDRELLSLSPTSSNSGPGLAASALRSQCASWLRPSFLDTSSTAAFPQPLLLLDLC